jgi:release factor glutamine methyltransferase
MNPARLHALGRYLQAMRYAFTEDMVLFHTSGPEAGRDAVFFGPDTQRFLDQLQSRLAGTRQVERIVEIGCGNGAAAIWMARRFSSAQVIGTDVNPSALVLAKVNCQLAGVSNLSLRRSDILAEIEGKFDLIAAIRPSWPNDQERTYRNGGGSYGMELPARIVRESVAKLAPGGTLLMYTASPIVNGAPVLAQLLEGVAHDLEKVGEGDFEYMKDLDAYNDVDAIETAVLTVNVPG